MSRLWPTIYDPKSSLVSSNQIHLYRHHSSFTYSTSGQSICSQLSCAIRPTTRNVTRLVRMIGEQHPAGWHGNFRILHQPRYLYDDAVPIPKTVQSDRNILLQDLSASLFLFTLSLLYIPSHHKYVLCQNQRLLLIRSGVLVLCLSVLQKEELRQFQMT